MEFLSRSSWNKTTPSGPKSKVHCEVQQRLPAFQEHVGLGRREGGRGAQHDAHVLCRVVLDGKLEEIAWR